MGRGGGLLQPGAATGSQLTLCGAGAPADRSAETAIAFVRKLKTCFLILPILGAAVLLQSGCAGYHLGAVNDQIEGDKSVEVLPFNNQTFEPRLGDAVTQAL